MIRSPVGEAASIPVRGARGGGRLHPDKRCGFAAMVHTPGTQGPLGAADITLGCKGCETGVLGHSVALQAVPAAVPSLLCLPKAPRSWDSPVQW